MSITAKELASLLHLSEAAVSLALNRKPGVSIATRERVMEAAKQNGYDFSRIKSSGHPAGSICFVMYKKSGAVVNENPFFSLLTDGAGMGCKKSGYELNIRYLYEDESLPDQLRQLEASQFSGMVLLATEMDVPALEKFSDISFPILILDAYLETLPYNYVLINNTQGAYLATSHLISRRKAQPGYLRSSYRISNFDERADGFYKAIRNSGMSTAKSPVHALTPSREGAYEDMKLLIRSGEELASCYFADNDLIAAGAATAMKEAGYRIPQDIAIVGFDNLPLCEVFDPPLTTIHVPTHYMGETAVTRLIDMIEKKDTTPVKTEICTTLVKRKSD